MGANISLETIPENIDQETFKKICGDRYDNELYDAIKNPVTGFVSKALFLKELSTKTHVFLTHDWGMDEQGRDNHGRVAKVNKWLKAHNIVTWFDEDRMKGNILQQMFQGIDNSRLVIVFVTKNYIDKVAGRSPKGEGDNCLKEFHYAENKKTVSKMLAVVQEPRCRDQRAWSGPLGILSSHLYTDNSDDRTFEASMESLRAKILENIPPAELNLDDTVAQAFAAVPSTTLKDEKQKREQEMFDWIVSNAPSIHGENAKKYATAFYSDKQANIERVARKIKAEPNWLKSLHIVGDDADDLIDAMRRAGYQNMGTKISVKPQPLQGMRAANVGDAIRISGATGRYANIINGVYEPTTELSMDMRVYKKTIFLGGSQKKTNCGWSSCLARVA